jgi:hypothetical protein
MKNKDTFSQETLALLAELDAELKAHQSRSREDRELARQAYRDAQAEAALAYA